MANAPAKNILIIDDDKDILVFWKFMLESLNEEPPLTFSSAALLKSADINYGNVKLAIFDFQFEASDVDGADIIAFLRQKGVNRIYLSTGYADQGDVCRKSRDMGIDGIISKPVSKEKIKEIFLNNLTQQNA